MQNFSHVKCKIKNGHRWYIRTICHTLHYCLTIDLVIWYPRDIWYVQTSFFFVKYKKLALLSLGQIQNLVKKVLYEGHGACLVYNLHGKKFSLSWTASWGPNSHSPVICQNDNSKYKIATRLSVQTMYIDENALRGLLLTSVLSGAAP